jgi:Uma2 family endonuclease
VLINEPELHFGDDVLVPDIAGWRRERMPALPGTAYFTLAPDWLCEVLSPTIERSIARESSQSASPSSR